jgi:hypothetical protein
MTRRNWFSEFSNNVPLSDDKLRIGMQLAVAFANIRDHKTPAEFESKN